jgi:hypothetical protein
MANIIKCCGRLCQRNFAFQATDCYAEGMTDDAPKRLTFKTFLAMVHGSVGANMFRHFYMQRADGSEFDALDDGDNGCAFFVSSVLTIFGKIEHVHGTVANTIEDLQNSSWIEAQTPTIGDVLVWEPKSFANGDMHAHIGFFVGNGKAISMSSQVGAPVEHDIHFGNEQRVITHIFHSVDWGTGSSSARPRTMRT